MPAPQSWSAAAAHYKDGSEYRQGGNDDKCWELLQSAFLSVFTDSISESLRDVSGKKSGHLLTDVPHNTKQQCWALVRSPPGEVELQLAWSLWTDTADGKQRGVQLVLHRWASVKRWGAPRRPPRAVHTLCSNIRSHYMEFRYFWWGLSVTKRRPDWKVLKKLYNWWQITMWKGHFPKDFRVPSSTVLQLLRTEPQHSGLQVVGQSARVVHMAGSQYTCVSNGIQWDTQVVITQSPMNY